VKRVDAILTVSHAVRDDVVECLEIAPEKVFVTPLGVPQLPPAAPEVRQKPYLLSVGTLEPRKNMARLAEAFTRSHLSSAFDLVICGRVGWGATVPGVTVIDGASDDRLAALYRGATAMILPSLYEGFGLPLVEALSLGVPVYCSDTPVFREVAGNHAHFFDPWDIDSITDAVIKAAKEAAPAPGGAAHASRFTWEACAHATLAAYDAVRAS
jgi:glycosyltransferase involved in cell wall biosynthesis